MGNVHVFQLDPQALQDKDWQRTVISMNGVSMENRSQHWFCAFCVLYFFAFHCSIGKKTYLKSNSCSLLFRLKWSCQWSLPVGSLAWKGCRPGSRLGFLGSRLLLSPSELRGHVSPYSGFRKSPGWWVMPVFSPPKDLSVQPAPCGQ